LEADLSTHHFLDFPSSRPVSPKAHGTSARYRAECVSNTETVNPDFDHDLSFFLTAERNRLESPVVPAGTVNGPSKLRQIDVATAPPSIHQSLTTECPRCEQGVRFNGNHPGGGTRCETCDGDGVVPLLCECCPNDTEATEWVGGIALCPVCAEAEKVGAFSADEADAQSAAIAEEDAARERADHSWGGVGL
jgi:hypothetical protein